MEGTASPCFVSHLLSDLTSNEDTEDQVETIKGCAGLAYAGELVFMIHLTGVLTSAIHSGCRERK